MNSLAILVAAAAAGYTMAHWLKLPVIPLLVVFGVGLSHFGFVTDAAAFEDLLGLGLTFLVYAAGIELNPRRFRGKLEEVLWTSILQFSVLAFSGYGLARLLGFDPLSAIYLGGALGTSSTLVVIHQLQRRVGSLRSYGRLAIGVLLAQDLAIIVAFVVITSLPGGIVSLGKGLGAVTFLGILAILAQQRFFPWIAKQTKLDDEIVLLILLGTLFVFAGIANELDLPFVVGAFCAGFSLSSFPINGVARSLLASLTSLFRALFFTALGAMAVFPDPMLIAKALAFAFLVLLLTPPIVTAIAEWKGGLSSRNAITCGLLLAQTSEFSLVIGLYALHLDRISSDVMSVITIIAVTTMTITPLIASSWVANWFLQFHPLRKRQRTETKLQDHVLMLGAGAEGSRMVQALQNAGHEVVVVDHDPVVIGHLEAAGIPCIRGDATDDKVSRRAGFHCAKLILVAMPNIQDALKVLQFTRSQDTAVIVSVFEEKHAGEIESHGGTPILISHAAADSFIKWFEDHSKR